MTFALIAALVGVCVLGHVFHDQAHRRLARSSERFLDALIAAGDRNQGNADAHRAEIQGLLQRIQAPHVAVAEHHAATSLPAESDGLPMTDEQVAELQERERIIKWMEAVENGDGNMLEVPE